MRIEQEQLDFFHMLKLKTDWRGAIYGEAKSDEKTACGTCEGSSEAETQKKVKEN